jgi:hypothetical protein
VAGAAGKPQVVSGLPQGLLTYQPLRAWAFQGKKKFDSAVADDRECDHILAPICTEGTIT